MRYHVLACDYDGTLAHNGRVEAATLAALERLLASGRQLVLATGRELGELLAVFPEIDLFTLVVAENGALLYKPSSKEDKLLARAPPPGFVEALRQRGVSPLSAGRVIVATWRPHETALLETIRDQGLDLQVIFNKEAVMVLPAGVNKASGLTAALAELGQTPHEAVGVGDAENDHAFLNLCECAVAVANALPPVQDRADWVTSGERGAGVAELIDRLLRDDLAEMEGRLSRHHLLLGTTRDGSEVRLAPYGHNLLIAGPSGSGKSTAATGFLERLLDKNYQFCILDPEGDYERLKGAVTLGGAKRGPTADEVLQLLANSRENAVVNLVGLPVTDRPPFFLSLLPRLQEMRVKTGRPHWLILDEAHHLMPASWEPGSGLLPQDLQRTLLITVHPGQVSPAVLRSVDTILAVGPTPAETVGLFCRAVGEQPPAVAATEPDNGEVFLWSRPDRAGKVIRLAPSRLEHQRHSRKYAEGELPPERSFFFRGPEGKLNLRAQNLILFLQIADGVDDDTWVHHLSRGDYSAWFRDKIKDETLAREAAAIEEQAGLSPAESRARIRAAVERYYTQAAGPPLPIPGTDAAPTRQ